jgi:hypothetical protein
LLKKARKRNNVKGNFIRDIWNRFDLDIKVAEENLAANMFFTFGKLNPIISGCRSLSKETSWINFFNYNHFLNLVE